MTTDYKTQVVRIDFLTRPAAKQFQKFESADRARIYKLFVEGISSSKCTPVYKLGKFEVMHFPIPGKAYGCRVSYCNVDSGNVVIHLGTHRSFENFVKRFQGVITTNLTSVAELTPTVTSAVAAAKTTTASENLIPASERSSTAELDHLIGEIVTAVSGRCSEKFETTMAMALEIKELGNYLAEEFDEIRQQADRIDNTWIEHIASVRDEAKVLRRDLAECSSDVSNQVVSLASRLDSLDNLVGIGASAQIRLESVLDFLAGQLEITNETMRSQNTSNEIAIRRAMLRYVLVAQHVRRQHGEIVSLHKRVRELGSTVESLNLGTLVSCAASNGWRNTCRVVRSIGSALSRVFQFCLPPANGLSARLTKLLSPLGLLRMRNQNISDIR